MARVHCLRLKANARTRIVRGLDMLEAALLVALVTHYNNTASNLQYWRFNAFLMKLERASG